MRAHNKATLLLFSLLSLSALLSCEQKQPPLCNTSAREAHQTVAVTFVYLPDSARTELIIHGDSCSLKRYGANDSLLSSLDTILTDSSKTARDSLLGLLDSISVGAYAREHVLDGTRIWIRWGDKEVYCDNCLHDYIRQALGLSASTVTNKNLEKIKNAVGMINVFINSVEKGRDTTQRAASLRQLQDTYRQRYRRSIQFADAPGSDSMHTTTTKQQALP